LTLDALRPPSPFDATAAGYKDWLHLNLFDRASGGIGLVNVSLHGDPEDSRARAAGVALWNTPDLGWQGGMEISDLREARLGNSSIALERVAIAVDHRGQRVLASARFGELDLELDVSAHFDAAPIDVEQRLPIGGGWISWFAVPKLTIEGSVRARDKRIDLCSAVGYHDHNWGRWHWGDDVGWQWGVLTACGPGPTFVLSRVAGRDHRRSRGEPMLIVDAGGRRRRFVGRAIAYQWDGVLDVPLRRIPGALAALHSDRARPRLPSRVHITADDGIDHVEIQFGPRAAAQLIAADPSRAGYGFVHELLGEFEFAARIEGVASSGGGLAVIEHAD
jgi:hypothetical protein